MYIFILIYVYFFFLTRWFVNYSELRSKFDFYDENFTPEKAMLSRSFRNHALNIETFLESVVLNVDKKYELSLLLIELGKQHHKLGADQMYTTVR